MPMIELTVPAGSLTPATSAPLLDDLAACLLRWEKAPDTEFVREVTWTCLHEVHALVVAAAGLDEHSLHVWTLVHEVPDGNWGAAGQTVRYAQLTQVAAAERAGSPA